MTIFYHIKRFIYNLILGGIPYIIVTYYAEKNLARIVGILSIIFVVVNGIIWINDIIVWNGGYCALCRCSWIPIESDEQSISTYQCSCGRKILI